MTKPRIMHERAAINIYLTPEHRARLLECAGARNLSPSGWVRWLLDVLKDSEKTYVLQVQESAAGQGFSRSALEPCPHCVSASHCARRQQP
jgi:hypothetical protein